MTFGVEKCKTQAIRKSVQQQIPDITQANEIIKTQERNETCKYLGFHQSANIDDTKTKTKLQEKDLTENGNC